MDQICGSSLVIIFRPFDWFDGDHVGKGVGLGVFAYNAVDGDTGVEVAVGSRKEVHFCNS